MGIYASSSISRLPSLAVPKQTYYVPTARTNATDATESFPTLPVAHTPLVLPARKQQMLSICLPNRDRGGQDFLMITVPFSTPLPAPGTNLLPMDGLTFSPLL